MKKTKSLFALLFLLILSSIRLNAQYGPVAVGGNTIGQNGSVSYSIGQVDFITASGIGGTITQGLQQPYEIFVVGMDDDPHTRLEITAYPNPAVFQVSLRVKNLKTEGLFYKVYDQNGRLLVRHILAGNITIIPLHDFPSSTFILSVSNKNAEIKSFKIVKQ